MKPNLAERAGRWSAAHWKTAAFGWLAFVAIAVVLGQALGVVNLTDTESATGETARAEAILSRAGFNDHAGESVLVQSRTRDVGDPAFQRTVKRVVAKLETLPTVRDVRSPLAHGREGQLSADRHSALVQFSISGSSDTADSRVQPVLNEVTKLQQASPGFTVAEFGEASADHEVGKVVNKDLSHAEKLSVPVTFLVLLIAFGAFVAAGVPVLLAFSGVLGSLGHRGRRQPPVPRLRRHQLGDAADRHGRRRRLLALLPQARARGAQDGRAPDDALGRAAATSGRAVLISGGTVMIAMAGMLLAGNKVFSSIGIGAMIVVFTTMVGSLTVLPAVLGKLGDRVERGVLAVLAAGLLRLVRPLGRPRLLVWLRDRRTLLQRVKGDRQSRGPGRSCCARCCASPPSRRRSRWPSCW